MLLPFCRTLAQGWPHERFSSVFKWDSSGDLYKYISCMSFRRSKPRNIKRGISSNRPCGLPLCNSPLSPWTPTKLNGDKMAPGYFAAGRSCLSVGHWHKAGLAGGFQQEFKRTSISCISFRQLGAKKHTWKKKQQPNTPGNLLEQTVRSSSLLQPTLDANEIEWG